MNFEELVTGLPAPTEHLEQIDVSDLFGKPAGEVTFTFAEPTVAEMFGIQEVSKRLKIQRPKWPEALCNTVALMSLAHQAPDPGKQSVLMLYMALAERLKLKQVTALTQRFIERFPDLANIDTAADAAKND